MLALVRSRVHAASSVKLYMPTSLFESLGGRMPLHASGLWPEHSAFEFTFGYNRSTMESAVQLLVAQVERGDGG